MPINIQISWLFLLAIPIACIAWTVTHEEIFREPRDFFIEKSRSCKTIMQRKFFYLFICEYCFSHYVALAFLIITKYHLLFTDWRGYLIGGFALIWIANVYMSLFAYLKQNIKKEKTEIEYLEKEKNIVEGQSN